MGDTTGYREEGGCSWGEEHVAPSRLRLEEGDSLSWAHAALLAVALWGFPSPSWPQGNKAFQGPGILTSERVPAGQAGIRKVPGLQQEHGTC